MENDRSTKKKGGREGLMSLQYVVGSRHQKDPKVCATVELEYKVNRNAANFLNSKVNLLYLLMTNFNSELL